MTVDDWQKPSSDWCGLLASQVANPYVCRWAAMFVHNQRVVFHIGTVPTAITRTVSYASSENSKDHEAIVYYILLFTKKVRIVWPFNNMVPGPVRSSSLAQPSNSI